MKLERSLYEACLRLLSGGESEEFPWRHCCHLRSRCCATSTLRRRCGVIAGQGIGLHWMAPQPRGLNVSYGICFILFYYVCTIHHMCIYVICVSYTHNIHVSCLFNHSTGSELVHHMSHYILVSHISHMSRVPSTTYLQYIHLRVQAMVQATYPRKSKPWDPARKLDSCLPELEGQLFQIQKVRFGYIYIYTYVYIYTYIHT